MSQEQIINEIHNEPVNVEPDSVIDHYSRLRLLVESMESDILKNSNGNKTAGTRMRKSLRLLKGYAADFVKYSISADKT